jgi:hypothetical protein
MIAKVEDNSRVSNILRSTPIRQGVQGWNCVSWIKEVLEKFKGENKALGTKVIEWGRIRDGAMAYCQRKTSEHRFDGKGNFDMSKTPTYDLIEGKETVP